MGFELGFESYETSRLSETAGVGLEKISELRKKYNRRLELNSVLEAQRESAINRLKKWGVTVPELNSGLDQFTKQKLTGTEAQLKKVLESAGDAILDDFNVAESHANILQLRADGLQKDIFTLQKAEQDAIKKIAEQRTLADMKQAQNALEAQRFYSSISDATCGYSAEESAKFFEDMLNKQEIEDKATKIIKEAGSAIKKEGAEGAGAEIAETIKQKAADASVVEGAKGSVKTAKEAITTVEANTAGKVTSAAKEATTSAIQNPKGASLPAIKAEPVIENNTKSAFKKGLEKITTTVKNHKVASVLIASAVVIGGALAIRNFVKNRENKQA